MIEMNESLESLTKLYAEARLIEWQQSFNQASSSFDNNYIKKLVEDWPELMKYFEQMASAGKPKGSKSA